MDSLEKIQVLGSRVLISLTKKEEKTRTGIYIPSGAQENPNIGKVLKVGDSVETVNLGDSIMYPRNAGTEILIEGNQHLLINEIDVIAILE